MWHCKRGSWLLVPLLLSFCMLWENSQSWGVANSARWREGHEVEHLEGTVLRSGDRLIFVAEDGRRLTLLENLALERVLGYLNEEDAAYDWTVSGRVTEFRGSNYLLLRTAHLGSATSSSRGPQR